MIGTDTGRPLWMVIGTYAQYKNVVKGRLRFSKKVIVYNTKLNTIYGCEFKQSLPCTNGHLSLYVTQFRAVQYCASCTYIA